MELAVTNSPHKRIAVEIDSKMSISTVWRWTELTANRIVAKSINEGPPLVASLIQFPPEHEGM